MTWLVANGVGVETAEGYASLVNGWHIDTMGYGLVSTNSFEDEQFKRTNQGLRRLHPAKKLERAEAAYATMLRYRRMVRISTKAKLEEAAGVGIYCLLALS